MLFCHIKNETFFFSLQILNCVFCTISASFFFFLLVCSPTSLFLSFNISDSFKKTYAFFSFFSLFLFYLFSSSFSPHAYTYTALLSCFQIIWEAYHIDFAQFDVPTLFIGCGEDKTINWQHTCGPQVFGKIPNAKTLLSVKPHETEHQHVLGSHFLSPSYVPEIQKTMTAFVGHHAQVEGF